MNWKTKLALIIGIATLLAGLSTVIYFQNKLINKQNEIDNSFIEFKKLNDEVVRNQSEYLTKKDLEKFSKDIGLDLNPIKKDLEKLGADITGISEVFAQSNGGNVSDIPSDSTIPRPKADIPNNTNVTCLDGTNITCPNIDEFGYISNIQVLKLNEFFIKNKVPWGIVKFSAWKKNPWSLKTHARKYSTITVLSQDENGRHVVHTKFSVGVNGKEYNIPIDKAKFVEQYPESKFRFQPRLTFGIDAGLLVGPDLQGEFAPTLQISPFNFGKTKANPEWMFLNTGLGLEVNSKNVNVMLSPVNYNIAKHLPLVDNAYIGPSLGLDLNGNWLLATGFRVGL